MEMTVSAYVLQKDQSIHVVTPSEKIRILVDALRLVSSDSDIRFKTLLIPDDCEKYGFVEGKHQLGVFLQFLADMLEE